MIDTEEATHFNDILERKVRELRPEMKIASGDYSLPQICSHLSPHLEEDPTVFFIQLTQNILHDLDPYSLFKTTEEAPPALQSLNPPTHATTKQIVHQQFGAILYIKINGFWKSIVPEYLKNLFENPHNLQGVEKIVLDVRDNGGGIIGDACDTVDFFLPENLRIVTYRKRGFSNSTEKTYIDGKIDTILPQLISLPVDVLVNRNTASSAEILAGALQHYKRARILGENTYGKTAILVEKDLISKLHIQFTATVRYTRGKYWIGENMSATDLRPDKYLENPNAPIEELLPILLP